MTKLEEIELRIRQTGDGMWTSCELMSEHAKAIAAELDRLRGLVIQLEAIETLHRKKLATADAEIAALKGEAERTVYICTDEGPSGAVESVDLGYGCPSLEVAKDGVDPTELPYEVRISARLVKP